MTVNVGQTIKSKDIEAALGQLVLSHVLGVSLMVPNVWADQPAIVGSQSSVTLRLYLPWEDTIQDRVITSDWADADGIASAVVLGDYVYALLVDTGTNPDTYRVYRYAKSNLAAGGTLCTFSGAVTLTATNSSLKMSSDGTKLLFNFAAGTSANDYAIATYTVTGTALAYSATVNLGSTANRANLFHGRTNGDYIAYSTSDLTYRRYNSSGTLQATGIAYASEGNQGVLAYFNDDQLYLEYKGDTNTAATLNVLLRVLIQ